MREIIVDNFAGGGGASTGIELATGRSVDIAINHDPAAIAMHKVNHPDTVHYNENVWDIDPVEVVEGRPVALCWLSPDCKHFSKAKGGKPVEKGIRGLAWVGVRWAAIVKPRVIMLENVEEFKDWSPLIEGRPDPKQKGRTFNTFVNALKRQGYKVEWNELVAADYGAPTTRKRFFLVARRDGKPIVWPKQTHAPVHKSEVKRKTLKPWRTAAEIIDWTIPCPSIFERKKPLSPNTMRRIARGLKKFIIDNKNPFIAPVIENRNNNSHLVTAFLAQYHTETSNREARGQTLDRPLMTLDTSNRYALVVANIVKHYGGNYTGPGISLNDPLSTITTTDHHALITSHLVKLKGTNIGQPATEPIQTITAGGTHFGEIRAYLLKYYGSAENGQTLDGPLHTITTKDRFGLVTIHGTDYKIVDIGMRMLEPHELFAAQGFPSKYVIDVDANGKKYSKSAQVARCGNAVPPPFAEALVRANMPELCTGSGNTLTFERYAKAEGQLQLSM